MARAILRDCNTCGKRFQGPYRRCYECRATDRACVECGAVFHGVSTRCADCYRTQRQCVTCGKPLRSRYRECRTCRAAKITLPPCQMPGCGNPKAAGQGSKLCQEHRETAYQRKLEHLRKTTCYMEGCPEPKLPGKYRYCAQHSAEGPQRERVQVMRRKRERQFGVTHDEYLALLEAQGGACAICGDGEQRRSLAVDHDHVTGAVRGLLCDRCNPMLGYARDSIAILEAAIEYLKKNQVPIPPHAV